MEGKLNISEKVVDDLTIRQRRNHILGICPVCGCRDANFNKVKGAGIALVLVLLWMKRVNLYTQLVK